MWVNENPENSDVSGESDSSIKTIYFTSSASSCCRLTLWLDSQSKIRIVEDLSLLFKSVALSMMFGKSGNLPDMHK